MRRIALNDAGCGFPVFEGKIPDDKLYKLAGSLEAHTVCKRSIWESNGIPIYTCSQEQWPCFNQPVECPL